MHYGDCCLQSTLKSHFLAFIGQEGPRLEIYDIILHSKTYSCLHRWNCPLRVYTNKSNKMVTFQMLLNQYVTKLKLQENQ